VPGNEHFDVRRAFGKDAESGRLEARAPQLNEGGTTKHYSFGAISSKRTPCKLPMRACWQSVLFGRAEHRPQVSAPGEFLNPLIREHTDMAQSAE
jgi:hypothetical protein